MADQQINKDSLYDLCLIIVSNHFNQEMELFDDVWAAFWHSTRCENLMQLADALIVPDRSQDFLVGEFAAVDSNVQAFDILYVMSALSCATASLIKKQENSAISTEDILMSLKTSMSRLAVPTHVAGIIERHAVQLVAKLFHVIEKEHSGDNEIITGEPICSPELVYVVLMKQSHEKAQPLTIITAPRLRAEAWVSRLVVKYDLVVNERVNEPFLAEVFVRGRKEDISYRRFRARSALWSVLTHIGRVLEFKSIVKIRHKTRKKPPNMETSPPVYMNELKALLKDEDLADKMWRSIGDQKYYCMDYGWTLCWVREHSNPMTSNLIFGRYQSSDKQNE